MLYHYRSEPITLDRERRYEQTNGNGELWTYEKPVGLWVSVYGDDDWPAWCRGDVRIDTLAVEHHVTLANTANVLTLASPADLDEFTAEYAAPDRRGGPKYVGGSLYWGIDWARVASLYDGIIIAPYQWSRRYTLSWYYGWDCADELAWANDLFRDEAADELEANP